MLDLQYDATESRIPSTFFNRDRDSKDMFERSGGGSARSNQGRVGLETDVTGYAYWTHPGAAISNNTSPAGCLPET